MPARSARREGILARIVRDLLVGCCLTCAIVTPASAQSSSSYILDVWQTDDGLPHSSITALVQTRDGYLWIGTAAGLVRFDGVRFAPVTGDAADHLESGYVWTLYEDTDGALWAASGGGLSRLGPDGAQLFTAADGLPPSFVRAVVRDPQDILWIATYGDGVCRLVGARFDCLGAAAGLPDPFANTLHLDDTGTLWVGTDTGVSRWTGTRFAPVPFPNGRTDVKAIEQAADGMLWLGTGDGVFEQTADSTWIAGPPLGAIRALHNDPAGALWVGTEADGLFRLQEDTTTPFRAGAGLTHNDIRVLLRDREGSLWVGTNGGGLNRIRASTVTTLGLAEGLPGEVVSTVLESRTGAVWIGTNGGLARLQDGTLTTYTRREGLAGERIQALAETGDGALWVGTNGDGLNRMQGGRIDTYTTADGLPSNVIFSLYEDPRGQLWVGTGGGLARWNGQTFTVYTTADRLANNLVVVMQAYGPDALLVGTDGGLSLWRDGRFTNYGTADGLPSVFIRALHVDAPEDGEQTAWIGTRGGLARFQDGSIDAVTTADGLPDAVVYQILEDDQGDLWINSAKQGIYRLARPNLEAVAAGTAETLTPLFVGRADGLRSTEGVGGYQPAGWKARDGRLWFPTHQGVVSFDPAALETPSPPPPVYIEAVLVDDQPRAVQDGHVDLPPDAQRIEIRYTAVSFLDPERIQFRHRLEGAEAAWVYDSGPTGARRVRTFQNLAPDAYVFRVAAATADGVWSPAEATLGITVRPPWWQTPWAYLLFVLFAASSVYGVVRWRVWALQQRNVALEALVAERTAQVEAQAERLRELDALKSRLFANLSHEFRTPLTLILGPLDDLIDRDDLAGAHPRLRSMRDQARRLLRLINQLLDLAKLEAGSLELSLRRIDLVAFLARITASCAPLAESKGIDLTFQANMEHLDLAADPDLLEQVFYNLLANAIKFTPAGGQVHLGLEQANAEALVVVRDTGPGIPEDVLPHIFDRFYQGHIDAGTVGTGIGLTLARDVVRLHGGEIDVASTIGAGTTFRLRLPATLQAPSEAPPPTLDAIPAAEPTPDDAAEMTDEEAPPPDAPLVLVVEDNDQVRTYLRECLASRYRVAEAAAGEDGLHRAARDQPALIISDVMMPGLDGFELCRRIKADDALNHIPVILLTAKATAPSKLEGLEAGADDYLTKPFSPAELLIRAENLIEVRRTLRRRFSGEFVVQPTDIAVPSADAAFLKEVRRIVEAHLGDSDFSVEQLADEVHLSRRQLHRKLRALTDLSTVGFIRTMRLERAAQLLEQNAATVSEIAYQVGFQDPNYFTRLFRQAFGVPPSEYEGEQTSS